MLYEQFSPDKIIAVDVYLEQRKTRVYVGRLEKFKRKKQEEYVFNYDDQYLYGKIDLMLGPDIPLIKKTHRSRFLFKSFNDRIPSSKNPSYEEYCKNVGISPKEKNQLILLATIGRRGPSSFVFEPVYQDDYLVEDVKAFREELGLSLRDFASVFDFSAKTIQSIETGKVTGKDSLKRIALYSKFPEVALYEVIKNGAALHDNKRSAVVKILKTKIKNDPHLKNKAFLLDKHFLPDGVS